MFAWCVAANFAMNAWGLDTLIRVAKGVIKKAAEERADPADQDWYARQDARIEEAEQGAATLAGEPLRGQRAHIAALKRGANARAGWSETGSKKRHRHQSQESLGDDA
jgi:hypothetical protein